MTFLRTDIRARQGEKSDGREKMSGSRKTETGGGGGGRGGRYSLERTVGRNEGFQDEDTCRLRRGIGEGEADTKGPQE